MYTPRLEWNRHYNHITTKLYTHDNVKAAECMVINILVKANSFLQIKERIKAVEGFISPKNLVLGIVEVGQHDQGIRSFGHMRRPTKFDFRPITHTYKPLL
jgi:hypothetical protein